MGRTHKVLWIVQGVLALVFLFAGGFKLVTPIDVLAKQSAMPGPFVKFIGVAETLGALGLILPGLTRIRPGLTPLAASGLFLIMTGATGLTLARGAPGAGIPAVIGLLAAFVAWGRWTIAPLGGGAPIPARRILRSAAAVLAGLIAIFVLSIGTDATLHAAGIFPALGQPMAGSPLALALAYRIAYGIAGCWLTARLAPRQPLQHALALGALGVVLSTAGATAMWDAGPAWYSLGVIAISVPCAWIGGRLGTRNAVTQADLIEAG